METEQSFEAALERLEEIVELLEEGEAPLEQAMILYEEGVKLTALCQGKLSTAEQKLDQILEQDGTLREKGGSQ
ncbi:MULTISPECIES: exodeoxyribonuclease VII small subunit [Exiguobacterium]|uniref:Exodeoxyribonuclease 7 small subunit n=1 Tax=Exiguobacterium antarcticum TaxID=132920 RepID=A0ABT6R2Z0_9BACL|nr:MULTISPECIES: exodeoxyribonuclease VII small subunit [Exiguobacterium]AFS70019.1 exodeoxyribonuclease VII, small subunit [Exiguobacterium antarcticum B7]MCT4780059.1 exodeoxyribonuclease VII small subunit [Exiguobacterium soli]MDI3235313.1 exodeoxyribonuclease VII small subunit [Exiguobacterium antarcticum]